MFVVALCLTVVNPICNTRGAHVLFIVFNRPYTLEALLYGAALAGVVLTMLLWFGCYNYVLTGDKFTSLFGNLIPSISLLLVMILRMVPNLIKKARQISGARKSIGKGEEGKLKETVAVLSALVSWALEGGIVTADSMRARGYGAAKRGSFQIYHVTKRDWCLLVVQLLLLAAVIVSVVLGQADAIYIPTVAITPLSWGAILYGIYLSLPMLLNVKEAIVWRISKFGI